MTREQVGVALDDVELPGVLDVPEDARGLVVFAHGSGSSRHSPRNQQVAARLVEDRLATLLFDLLTEEEGADRENVFDVPLLGGRVRGAVEWAHDRLGLPVALFGASTGAAAALQAAAERPGRVATVVSRGGRPDLCTRLGEVRCPVLLVVGGDDAQVLDLNRQAASELDVAHELEVIEGAGHLFEGPGELEQVATLAASWCVDHLDGDDEGA